MFDRLVVELGRYAPKTTIDGVVSNLKKRSFDKYLNPEKEAYYNALKKFIDSARKLNLFVAVGQVHIQRSSPDLIWKGATVEINNYDFF